MAGAAVSRNEPPVVKSASDSSATVISIRNLRDKWRITRSPAVLTEVSQGQICKRKKPLGESLGSASCSCREGASSTLYARALPRITVHVDGWFFFFSSHTQLSHVIDASVDNTECWLSSFSTHNVGVSGSIDSRLLTHESHLRVTEGNNLEGWLTQRSSCSRGKLSPPGPSWRPGRCRWVGSSCPESSCTSCGCRSSQSPGRGGQTPAGGAGGARCKLEEVNPNYYWLLTTDEKN